MPANLTPDYRAAEEAFRKARDPLERLERLREMLRTIPKHKGTDHLQGDIKRRIKEMSEELERPARVLPCIAPDGTARRGTSVPAGYVYVDGLSVGEVGDVVLRDRRALANDGMFMVVVTVDKQTGAVIGRPEIITRGFVHGNEQDRIIDEAAERIIAAIENPGDHISEVALLKSQIKDGVSRYLYEQTKRRPMVFPVVVEV